MDRTSVAPPSGEPEEEEDAEKVPGVAQTGSQEHEMNATNNSTERSLDTNVPRRTLSSHNNANHTQDALSLDSSSENSEIDGPIDKWKPEFAGIRGQLSKASRSNIVSTGRKEEIANSQEKDAQREHI